VTPSKSRCERAGRTTIVPGKPECADRAYQFPYTNEFILLSFEGHHKPFTVVYELEGESPSYVPAADRAEDMEHGFLAFLKKLTHRYDE
jgi:hypothetical protein